MQEPGADFEEAPWADGEHAAPGMSGKHNGRDVDMPPDSWRRPAKCSDVMTSAARLADSAALGWDWVSMARPSGWAML